MAFGTLQEALDAKKKTKKKKKRKRAPAAEKGRSVNPPKTQEAIDKEEAEEAAPAHANPAPWADADCIACEGSGMSTSGKPCKICVSEAPGKLNPSNYERGVTSEGDILWTHKESGEETETKLDVGEATAKTIDRESEKPKRRRRRKKKASAEQEPLPEEPEAEDEPEEEAPEPVKKKVRRRKKKAEPEPEPEDEPEDEPEPLEDQVTPVDASASVGFALLFGCRPATSMGDVVELQSLLVEFGGILAKQKGETTYFALHPFERRDALAQAAHKIAKRLKGKTVVVPLPGTPDQTSFAEALRPHAATVIVAGA